MIEKLNGKTVLVVDDEPDLRELIACDLKSFGCKVMEAPSGKEAYRLFRAHAVDVVITDVEMPEGTGIELLSWIRKSESASRVLIMGGVAEEAERDAFDKGADGYLEKPFDSDTLCGAIVRALPDHHVRWTRKCHRVATDLKAEVSVVGGSSGLRGRVVNLSRGGMFLHVAEKIPKVGEVVSFVVHPPSEAEVSLGGSAVVRWNRPEPLGSQLPGCGLEFISLSHGARDRLMRWLAFVQRR